MYLKKGEIGNDVRVDVSTGNLIAGDGFNTNQEIQRQQDIAGSQKYWENEGKINIVSGDYESVSLNKDGILINMNSPEIAMLSPSREKLHNDGGERVTTPNADGSVNITYYDKEGNVMYQDNYKEGADIAINAALENFEVDVNQVKGFEIKKDVNDNITHIRDDSQGYTADFEYSGWGYKNQKISKEIITSHSNQDGRTLHFLYAFNEDNTQDWQLPEFKKGELEAFGEAAIYAANKGFNVVIDHEATSQDFLNAIHNDNTYGILTAAHASMHDNIVFRGYNNQNRESINDALGLNQIRQDDVSSNLGFLILHNCDSANYEKFIKPKLPETTRFWGHQGRFLPSHALEFNQIELPNYIDYANK